MGKTLHKILTCGLLVALAFGLWATPKNVSAVSSSSVYLPNGKYLVQNRNSKYLRAEWNNVNTSNNEGWQANEFYLERGRDDFYTIKHVNTGKMVDVAGASTKSGANVGVWDANGTCAQKWALDYDANGFYVFRNACSNLVLDVAGGLREAGANVQVWQSNGTAAQEWSLIRNERTYADILAGIQRWAINSALNYKSRYSLDVSGNRSANGTNVQIWPQNNSFAQTFRFEKNQDGSARIRSVGTGRSLDVSGAARYNGGNVAIWRDNNTCAQKWFISWNWAHDTYTFRNACSGKALDVSRGLAYTGNNVQIWEFNDTYAQEWFLTKRFI